MGKSVVIVCPDKHLGGLSSGGLGFTDTGNKAVIGGLSREFYHRVWLHYDSPRRGSGRSARSTATRARARPPSMDSSGRCGSSSRTSPSRSSRTSSAEHEIPVVRDEWLDREQGRQEGRRPHRVDHDPQRQDVRRQGVHRRHLRGRPDGRGRRRVPRRPRGESSDYDEQCNGVQTGVLHHRHHFGTKRRSAPTSCPATPRAASCPGSARAARRVRRGRQEGAGVLLPHVPDRPPGEPHPVRQARGLRPAAV